MKSLRTCCACTCKDYVCSLREKKNLKPAHPHLRMAEAGAPDLSQVPPADVPAALQGGIDKLSAPLRNLLISKSVPYTSSNTGWGWRTIPPLKIWLIAGILPRQQGNMDLRPCASKMGRMDLMKLFQVVRTSIRTCSNRTSDAAHKGSPLHTHRGGVFFFWLGCEPWHNCSGTRTFGTPLQTVQGDWLLQT